MNHSTPRATKSDQLRFTQLREIGCICCRISDVLGLIVPGNPLEIHHFLSGGVRRGHQFTIPLCRWHQRGICLNGRAWAMRYLGPSLAYGTKPFRLVYGTDDHLQRQCDLLIGYRCAA